MHDDTSIPSVIQISLGKNLVSIVDEIDRDLASIAWKPNIRKQIFCYACRWVHRTTIYLHRVILSRILDRPLAKGEVVDHINGNGLDNRRSNLRLATRAQNARNRGVNTKSKLGLKGVSYSKDTLKWRAYIMVNKKQIHLGLHNTPEEAAYAYNEAALKYHGDFASLNVIKDRQL